MKRRLLIRISLLIAITVGVRLAAPAAAPWYLGALASFSGGAPAEQMDVAESRSNAGEVGTPGGGAGGEAARDAWSQTAGFFFFNLLLFPALVCALSFDRLRTRPRQSIALLLAGCAMVIFLHIVMVILMRRVAGSPPGVPGAVLALRSVLGVVVSVLPLLLWAGWFTELPQWLALAGAGSPLGPQIRPRVGEM